MQTGIYATGATRAPKDMRGQTFPVEFEIIDHQDSPAAVAAAQSAAGDKGKEFRGAEFKKPNAPYVVKVLLTVRNTIDVVVVAHVQCLALAGT